MYNEKAQILVLVEGGKTDVTLMRHLLTVYGISQNHEIVPYNTNIYELYNHMFRDEDPNTIDFLQLLKEHEKDPAKKPIFDRRYPKSPAIQQIRWPVISNFFAFSL